MKASQDSFVSAGISGLTALVVGPVAFAVKGVDLWWAVSLMAAGVVLVLAGFAGYRMCLSRRSSAVAQAIFGVCVGICLIVMTMSCGWALELPAARLGAWWKMGLLICDIYAVFVTAQVLSGFDTEPTRAEGA